MVSLKTFALAGCVSLSATFATAATVSISSIEGVWQNSLLSDGGTATGEGTSSISWGQPATNLGASGFSFTSSSTPIVNDNPFEVGIFSHYNNPIYFTSLLSTDLLVNVTGSVGGIGFSLMSSFSLTHDETSNSGTCEYSGITVCPDRVSLVSSVTPTSSLEADGQIHTFFLDGFDTGGGPFTFFDTEENGLNTAVLVGRFETTPSPIPLPAAGWMMLAAIGFLGAARKFRIPVRPMSG
ncbi:THxN family PEP-CTERM protein [Aliiroseovarius subalbicans]|uniref:THxN family PEP-CTERM protein n=1 Tax=Aliiroseovarius subalbicans TaxID=2925840 RepID=UPI001F574612|nr:THxN family PEP-CTERM protein [Aliiroseovarius subalbicans]MCI2400412.1 VPLPA-CTERM sorting domain-containing protein [Aliiroseovarius subalbicans]